MAILARTSECPVMHVVLAMARDTFLGGRYALAGSCLVARVAIDGAMGSGQFEARIAGMVEDPAVPPVGRVALHAGGADAPLMMRVRVARFAPLRCLAIRLRAVTRGAADGGMQADQWKARQIMIEHDAGVPGLFIMAF